LLEPLNVLLLREIHHVAHAAIIEVIQLLQAVLRLVGHHGLRFD